MPVPRSWRTADCCSSELGTDRDPTRLTASLEEYVGHLAYDIGQLRQDLERFTFLLGGSDGGALFGP